MMSISLYKTKKNVKLGNMKL